ncbi:DUF397 domain-containing protein [Streptomyces sp. LHD-70]|uniref:DUF397 domain-containing protein n=1 Tax=Streptomyces sp. LHD-70 TaxID=3072140 RepID=UPI00280CB1E5|nr:DUF397 domain-containing protein [Streptomyces sp. LHD-70]MDQ8706609.1 DUF397 domain-containing protein [Streptomyces sp. LHD-70]
MSGSLGWFKSSYSSSTGGDCVEVASAPDRIHIRDSKTPDRARLVVGRATWENFLAWTNPNS